ncbi:MAG: SpoIIE family protein phosphatase [Cytophagales bacterium]|nr:SpoIIE family protein phosphatase [Armatimonadota bacterium]
MNSNPTQEPPTLPSAAKPESANNSLGDEAEQFRLLVENVEDYALFLMDADRKIVTWNIGAERILGYSQEEIVGESGLVIFTPEDIANGEAEHEIESAAREGRAKDERWHLRKDRSRFWASGILTALRDDAGDLRGYCKILRDFTERRKSEEALQAAYQKEKRISDTLQRALLLPVKEDAFHGVSVASLYAAAWEEALIGGDFFDAFMMSDHHLVLVVGDASGKGLEAAVRTSQVKDVMRAFFRSPEGVDATKTLARLNDYLCESKRLDNLREEGFVALALVLFDTATGIASFATAGAEPPVILRADGTTEIIPVGGIPLGVLPGQEYEAKTLSLARGDMIVIVTDGITEARRGDQFLEYQGMLDLARKAFPSGEVGTVARAILEGAYAFTGGSLQDDACLLLTRVN